MSSYKSVIKQTQCKQMCLQCITDIILSQILLSSSFSDSSAALAEGGAVSNDASVLHDVMSVESTRD